jgi:hypothetical protein
MPWKNRPNLSHNILSTPLKSEVTQKLWHFREAA